MQPTPIESTLRDRLLSDGFLAPTYRDFGIANVPDTVADLLDARADRPLPTETIEPAFEGTGGPIEHVIEVVIDGFGWNRFVDLWSEYEPLERLVREGGVTPLTSTFPSETAAAMVTLMTGLQPIEHGHLGWFIYLPSVDAVGLGLPFTTLEGEPLGEAYGVTERDLFDVSHRETVTDRLRAADVDVTFLQPSQVADSPTTRLGTAGAERVGYESVGEGFAYIRRDLQLAPDRTAHLLYYPDVDTAAHRFGSRSAAYRGALEAILRPLDRELFSRLPREVADRTLVLVLADHGIVDTDPETNYNLAQLEADGAVDLNAHIDRSSSGNRRYPAGSPRNVQLFARPDHRDPLRAEFDRAIDARTYVESEYRSTSLFGDRPPGPLFEQRAPDLLVVPRERGLWYDDGELSMIGMHGGLHPDEMLVPFVAARLSDL